MEIALIAHQQITPKNLAAALAGATPQEFAAFWFEFSHACKDDKKLDEFAKAMAPDFGGSRKDPFKKLAALVQFHEMSEARAESA